VRTELVYVPDVLHRPYVQRLLEEYLVDGGRLLVAAYRSRDEMQPPPPIDHVLARLGFAVERIARGFWNNEERTRVAVIRKPDLLHA
jgi:hypothetical protein